MGAGRRNKGGFLKLAASIVFALSLGAGVKVMLSDPEPKPEPKVSTLELTPVPVLEVWPVATPNSTPPGKRNAGNRPSTFVRSQKKVASLERIAQCESGSNPTAVSASGKYRGKYQADRRTWNGYQGYSDPAAAPESVQDAFAADLYAKRGAQPWPSCGRR